MAKTTPLNGCIRANSGHNSAHWSSTSASDVKARGITPERAEKDDAEGRTDDDGEPDHAHAGVVGGVRARGAKLLSDDDLPCDCNRIEHEGDEDPQLERDLVRGERRVAHPRHDHAGEDERGDQRDGADEDELAEREQAPS